MLNEDQSPQVDRPVELSTEQFNQDIQRANETRRKRILSEKQLSALARGREKRWKKEDPIKEERDNRLADLPMLKFPSEAEARDYPDINDQQGYDSTSSSSSDEDEEERRRKTLIKLKGAIPRSIRRKVDRYIKLKMTESKQQQQPSSEITPYDSYLNLPPLPPRSGRSMSSKPGELDPIDEETENLPPTRLYNPFPYSYL